MNRKTFRFSRSHNRKKKESYEPSFDYDTAYQGGGGQGGGAGSGSDHHGHELDDIHDTEDVHVSKSGYSEGSGLRSIAQGSADQATSAVANQHLAAKQASYIAQNNLANLALQASATGEDMSHKRVDIPARVSFYNSILSFHFFHMQQQTPLCKANRFCSPRSNKKA